MDNLTETEKEIVAVTALLDIEKSEDNYVDRSKLFYKSQLYRQALDDAKSALEINPKSSNALIAAGKSALKLQSFMESFEFYKEALVQDPKNSEIAEDLRNLQNVLLSDYERDSELAEREYNAVELCSQDVYPGDNELFKLEVEILLKKHKIDATKYIAPAQIDMKTRKDAASIAVMAYNSREDGRLQEALECIQVAIRKDGTNARMIQIRAEIFWELGEHVNALRDLMSIPKPHRIAEVWKLGGKERL
jgi:tetratricopeptide (TPR) repeat protein